jgi:hypothetical protein
MLCFCGYPLMQDVAPPFLCTHPTAAHKTVPDTFGLALWEPPAAPEESPAAAVEPEPEPEAANSKPRDKQK